MSSSTLRRLRRTAVAGAVALVTAAGALTAATAVPASAAVACTASFTPSAVGPGDETDLSIFGQPGVDYWWYEVVDNGAPTLYTHGSTPNGYNGFGTGYDYLVADYPGISTYTVKFFNGQPESPSIDAPECQATLTLGPGKQAQTIDFTDAPETHDLTWFPVGATASSELDVAFSSLTPETCDVTSTGGVTPITAGTCTVAADQEGNGSFLSAPQVTADITITAYDQEVVFAPITDRLLGSAPVSLDAYSTMDLTVDFVSETPSVCTIADGTAVLVAAGTCTVRAEQAGDPGIVMPASATRSFQVLPLVVPPPVVPIVPPVTPVTPVTPQPEPVASDLALTAPAGVALSAGTATVKTRTSGTAPVELSTTTAKVCAVNAAGKVRLLKVGTCTVAAAQAADAGHRAGRASASFPVWATPALPAKARAADVLTALGKGEGGYRVTASPAGVCRAVDGDVVLLDGGTCRVSVRSGGAVVRTGTVEVVVPAKPAATPKALDLGVTVYFEFDSARLTDEGRAALRAAARKLRAADLVVAYGHTYGPGGNSRHSRDLAARRAEAVVAYLDDLGVTSKAVSEVAMAMQQPVSSTAWKNRRVEVYFR